MVFVVINYNTSYWVNDLAVREILHNLWELRQFAEIELGSTTRPALKSCRLIFNTSSSSWNGLRTGIESVAELGRGRPALFFAQP